MNNIMIASVTLTYEGEDPEGEAQLEKHTISLSVSEEEVEDHDVRADNISRALCELTQTLKNYIDEGLIDVGIAAMLTEKFVEQCRDFHHFMGAGNVEWSTCPQCWCKCV